MKKIILLLVAIMQYSCSPLMSSMYGIQTPQKMSEIDIYDASSRLGLPAMDVFLLMKII